MGKKNDRVRRTEGSKADSGVERRALGEKKTSVAPKLHDGLKGSGKKAFWTKGANLPREQGKQDGAEKKKW